MAPLTFIEQITLDSLSLLPPKLKGACIKGRFFLTNILLDDGNIGVYINAKERATRDEEEFAEIALETYCRFRQIKNWYAC